MLRDAGVTLALGTDCNPGTSWCESVPYALQLAAPLLGLHRAGGDPGRHRGRRSGAAPARARRAQADPPGHLLVLEAEHEADLLAHLGAPAVRTTRSSGVCPCPAPGPSTDATRPGSPAHRPAATAGVRASSADAAGAVRITDDGSGAA